MIYTVTFNPALDYVIRVDHLELGETNRSTSEELYFGGKGVNVSLVLKELGKENTALGFIAGFTGAALADDLQKRGIKADFIPLKEGLTRINVKMKGAQETEINAQGPKIDEEAIAALWQKLEQLTAEDTLVLAGSVPSTLPADIYERILALLEQKGTRCVVDATGKLLLNVLKYKPFLIKPNHRELEELVGRELHNEAEIADAARELQAKGARNVLISRGKDGALLLTETDRVLTAGVAKVKAINTVGAGDSMVAGFVAGIDRGYEYALKLGSACGGATASLPGLATKDVIEKILNEI